MIIFSSIELEKALADQKVTRWQKAKYIIIPAIFLSMASPYLHFLGQVLKKNLQRYIRFHNYLL